MGHPTQAEAARTEKAAAPEAVRTEEAQAPADHSTEEARAGGAARKLSVLRAMFDNGWGLTLNGSLSQRSAFTSRTMTTAGKKQEDALLLEEEDVINLRSEKHQPVFQASMDAKHQAPFSSQAPTSSLLKPPPPISPSFQAKLSIHLAPSKGHCSPVVIEAIGVALENSNPSPPSIAERYPSAPETQTPEVLELPSAHLRFQHLSPPAPNAHRASLNPISPCPTAPQPLSPSALPPCNLSSPAVIHCAGSCFEAVAPSAPSESLGTSSLLTLSAAAPQPVPSPVCRPSAREACQTGSRRPVSPSTPHMLSPSAQCFRNSITPKIPQEVDNLGTEAVSTDQPFDGPSLSCSTTSLQIKPGTQPETNSRADPPSWAEHGAEGQGIDEGASGCSIPESTTPSPVGSINSDSSEDFSDLHHQPSYSTCSDRLSQSPTAGVRHLVPTLSGELSGDAQELISFRKMYYRLLNHVQRFESEKQRGDCSSQFLPAEFEGLDPEEPASLASFFTFRPLRHLVSGNKRRMHTSAFDLDLTYITPNIMAMSMPVESGTESLYRNTFHEVRRFLNQRHSENYKVFNLCEEYDYPRDIFPNKVERFEVKDHEPPTLEMVFEFCEQVARWMTGENSVLVVHCKGGKGRTGTMICAWLVFSGQMGASEAMQLFSSRRTQDYAFRKGSDQGVTGPSQRRLLYHLEDMVKTCRIASSKGFGLTPWLARAQVQKISKICIHPIAKLARLAGNGATLLISVADSKGKILASEAQEVNKDFISKPFAEFSFKEQGEGLVSSSGQFFDQKSRPIDADFRVSLTVHWNSLIRNSSKEVFFFWHHPAFLQHQITCIPKEALDKVSDDIYHSLVEQNFKCTMVLDKFSETSSDCESTDLLPAENSFPPENCDCKHSTAWTEQFSDSSLTACNFKVWTKDDGNWEYENLDLTPGAQIVLTCQNEHLSKSWLASTVEKFYRNDEGAAAEYGEEFVMSFADGTSKSIWTSEYEHLTTAFCQVIQTLETRKVRLTKSMLEYFAAMGTATLMELNQHLSYTLQLLVDISEEKGKPEQLSHVLKEDSMASSSTLNSISSTQSFDSTQTFHSEDGENWSVEHLMTFQPLNVLGQLDLELCRIREKKVESMMETIVWKLWEGSLPDGEGDGVESERIEDMELKDYVSTAAAVDLLAFFAISRKANLYRLAKNAHVRGYTLLEISIVVLQCLEMALGLRQDSSSRSDKQKDEVNLMDFLVSGTQKVDASQLEEQVPKQCQPVGSRETKFQRLSVNFQQEHSYPEWALAEMFCICLELFDAMWVDNTENSNADPIQRTVMEVGNCLKRLLRTAVLIDPASASQGPSLQWLQTQARMMAPPGRTNRGGSVFLRKSMRKKQGQGRSSRGRPAFLHSGDSQAQSPSHTNSARSMEGNLPELHPVLEQWV